MSLSLFCSSVKHDGDDDNNEGIEKRIGLFNHHHLLLLFLVLATPSLFSDGPVQSTGVIPTKKILERERGEERRKN